MNRQCAAFTLHDYAKRVLADCGESVLVSQAEVIVRRFGADSIRVGMDLHNYT